MGTTLQHGIFLPAEGERNCYTGLASNWTILDGVVGGYGSHAANLTIHVTAADKEAWNGKADASALTAHTGNTTIHVTAADKEAWNGKANASALTAHTGNTTIHVTAEDKNKWDAVTSKANDSDVVHKSGNETISGNKTFNGSTNCVGGLSQTALFKMTDDTSFITGSKNTSIYDQNGFQCANEQIVYNNSKNIRRSWTVNNNSSGTTITAGFNFILSALGGKVFYPISDGDTDNGTSSAYWRNTYTKLVNEVEPSSLSLPSGTVTEQIDISSYFTNTGSGDRNTYTASANGWIYLRLGNISGCQATILDANNNTMWGQSSTGSVEQLTIPILKGQTLSTQWNTSSTVYVDTAKFIPCQGNV